VRWLGNCRRIRRPARSAQERCFWRGPVTDGRRATTHWKLVRGLIRRAPRAEVDPIHFFIRDERLQHPRALLREWTSPWHWSRRLRITSGLGSGTWCCTLRRPGGHRNQRALSLQVADRQPLRDSRPGMLDNLNKPLTVPFWERSL